MADLSAIIVNYNSGWFCRNLVDSLQDQDFPSPRGGRGALEIIVVDNASPEDQHAWLDPLKERGVRVVYAERNTGYGGGCNLGLRFASAEHVLMANPDVVIMPGSLARLCEVLFHTPDAGVVGPRGWLDPGFHFLLPPVELPDTRSHLYETAGRIFKGVGRRFSLARARYALGYWTGDGVVDAEVISGYCFLMPAALARRLGPFDPDFPFYYEDDDLCVRAAREGRRLLFVKDTRVVHFYNKSAGPVFDEVIGKYYRSKSYFYRKHRGRFRHALYVLSTAFLKRYGDRFKGSGFAETRDLGVLDAPPALAPPGGAPAVVEITLDPTFVLAAGHLHPGGDYRMPELTWRALDATRWYLRFLDPECRRILATYTFEKASPAELPPAYAEMKGREP